MKDRLEICMNAQSFKELRKMNGLYVDGRLGGVYFENLTSVFE